MKIVKLGLNRLNATAKSAKAKEIVKDLTGNATFTTPSPTLASITTLATDLDTAILDAKAATDIAKTKTSVLHQKEDLLVAALNQLANYVENTANGDAAKIKSAGMDLKNEPTKLHGLPAPANFVATHGDEEGEIDLHWDSIYGAKSYAIEITSTTAAAKETAVTPTAWQHLMVSTKSSATIKNLTAGTRYYFRVAAVGASGQSAWSELATKVA
jgi:hypothetical protein